MTAQTHRTSFDPLQDLSPRELAKYVKVAEAAEIVSLSEDTFKRVYGDLVVPLSPRRNAVLLGALFARLQNKSV